MEFNKQGNGNKHLGSVGNITGFLGPEVDKIFTTTADALCFIHHTSATNGAQPHLTSYVKFTVLI